MEPKKASALVHELRAHRRRMKNGQGGGLSPQLAQYLQGMIQGWRRDPTAGDMSFTDWCASMAEITSRPMLRNRIWIGVQFALKLPFARYEEASDPAIHPEILNA